MKKNNIHLSVYLKISLFVCAFFANFIFFANHTVNAQSAIIQDVTASQKDYTFSAFSVKTVKDGKLSQEQLETLNDNIKFAFFTEVTNFKDKDMPTKVLTLPQILGTYTDLVKESLKTSEIHMGNTAISYQVLCNEKGILSIGITNEYMGAYPSGETKYASFDLKTGKLIQSNDKQDDIFVSAKAKIEFQVLLTKKIKKSIEAKIKESMSEPSDVETIKMNTNTIDLKYLQHAVTNKGLSFSYNFQFAHVTKALEPNGEFNFTWEEMSKFIKKDKAFAGFYKK